MRKINKEEIIKEIVYFLITVSIIYYFELGICKLFDLLPLSLVEVILYVLIGSLFGGFIKTIKNKRNKGCNKKNNRMLGKSKKCIIQKTKGYNSGSIINNKG